MTRPARHVLTAWIACLAILFGALVPGASQAVMRLASQAAAQAAAQAGAQFSAQFMDFPVCSAAGHDAPGEGKSPFGLDPSGHCQYCLDHHYCPALPSPGATGLLPVGDPVPPLLSYCAPEPAFHWAATRSRAPPVLS